VEVFELVACELPCGNNKNARRALKYLIHIESDICKLAVRSPDSSKGSVRRSAGLPTKEVHDLVWCRIS
jgi:hypothetical protein